MRENLSGIKHFICVGRGSHGDLSYEGILDGQRETALKSGDRVEVSRSQHRARLLRTQPPGLFYRRVMDRLTGKG